MIKFVLLLAWFTSTSWANVPTVESLFRHGSNPDITSSGISMTLVVKQLQHTDDKGANSIQDVSLVKDKRAEDFYKLFFHKSSGEALKISQTRYSNNSFTEASLEHEIHYSIFTSTTIKPSLDQLERGLFFSMLNSIVYNNGAHLVNYLKALGVPVKLNDELINREKIIQLANYKRYLITIEKDRNARKTLVNPLQPEDASARERINKIMNESMYVDMKQVTIGRDNGEIAWITAAGNFEAVVSYKRRQIQKIKYKSSAGDFEIQCKDYWLANGTHSLPRFIIVKGLKGESYQIELTNFRHYSEREDEVSKRVKKWEDTLRGRESGELRPEFLL